MAHLTQPVRLLCLDWGGQRTQHQTCDRAREPQAAASTSLPHPAATQKQGTQVPDLPRVIMQTCGPPMPETSVVPGGIAVGW